MRLILGIGLMVAWASPSAAADWEKLYAEEGITVWQRSVPESSFVAFRGKGVVDASMKRVLAMLADQDRKTEWLHNCVENRLVRAQPGHRMTIYNRTGSKFPLVADRDVVMKSEVSWSVKDRRVVVVARSTTDPRAPLVDGVVRMNSLDVRWELVGLDKDRTEVVYQVQADPGGLLPAWVVNMVSKKMPFKTLVNLREQVKKSGYDNAMAVVEMSFDWSSVGLSAGEASAPASSSSDKSKGKP